MLVSIKEALLYYVLSPVLSLFKEALLFYVLSPMLVSL